MYVTRAQTKAAVEPSLNGAKRGETVSKYNYFDDEIEEENEKRTHKKRTKVIFYDFEASSSP